MDPPIEVYGRVLKLIAEFAQPESERRWQVAYLERRCSIRGVCFLCPVLSAVRRDRRFRALSHLEQRNDSNAQRAKGQVPPSLRLRDAEL